MRTFNLLLNRVNLEEAHSDDSTEDELDKDNEESLDNINNVAIEYNKKELSFAYKNDAMWINIVSQLI